MRSFRTEGIIIKRRNISEADRLITIFTRKHGKLKLLAKGVRKITSRRLGHVEMLNHSIISAYEARSFSILTEAEILNDFSNIKNNLDKVGLGYHLCELLDGLCPEGVIYEEIFEIFKTALNNLSEKNDNLLTIRTFEIQLLTVLGYWHGNMADNLKLDTGSFIENIIERRLKSKEIFLKFN